MKNNYEFESAIKIELEKEIDYINKLIGEKKLEISKEEIKAKLFLAISCILAISHVLSTVLIQYELYFLPTSILSLVGGLSSVAALEAISGQKKINIKEKSNLIDERNNLTSELEKVNLGMVSENYTVSDDSISNVSDDSFSELYDLYISNKQYDEEFEEGHSPKVLRR